MSSLTPRGKVFFGLAFLLSASLCAGAAVALVKASDHEPTGGVVAPKPQTSFVLGSPSPSPSASPSSVATSAAPTLSPTAVPTSAAPAPAPSPTATAAPTRSPAPRPRATTSPTSGSRQGLALSAELDPAEGFIFPGTLITLTAHATDGQGEISLGSLTWGDGTPARKGGSGTACSKEEQPPAGGDCANFSFQHRYSQPGDYEITLRVTSGRESQVLTFPITIHPCSGPCATPTPTPSGASGT